MVFVTPHQIVRESMAKYGIVWNVRQDCIAPDALYGNHPFLKCSESWKFNFGEGCVGRAYARHETIIVEIPDLSDTTFLRKNIAQQCGIHTIAFMPQEDCTLLEVGFEQTREQLPINLWMSKFTNMANGDKQDEPLAYKAHRIRTPSPYFDRYQISQQPPYGFVTNMVAELAPDMCQPCKPDNVDDASTESEEWISAGSVGHPYSCGLPCKYNTRKWCKDESSCKHCHLCMWTRKGEREIKFKNDDESLRAHARKLRARARKSRARKRDAVVMSPNGDEQQAHEDSDA